MIQYTQGIFTMKGVSFKIPDNFLINCSPEGTNEYFMEILPPDQSYMLRIYIFEDCMTTEQEVSHEISEDAGGIALQPLAEVDIDGMKGHQIFVRGANTPLEIFCLHAALCEGSSDHLRLFVQTCHPNHIQDIYQSEDFQWFLKNIRHI